jgi:SAM-dependent methyltransferase
VGSHVKPSEFYTGLVAEMYDALVSYRAPAAFYADLIRKGGEPALEIGCGTGHPLLDLVEQGLDVHGLDSSRDMLARCEANFAGASFMLLPDTQDSERTLERIHHHLQPGGQAVIPLYVPPRMPEAQNATDQWSTRESIRPSDGATLRLSERYRYDWARQLRVATLRYEVITNGVVVDAVERPWLLRWYSPDEFRRLLRNAGFQTDVVFGKDGTPAADDAPAFIFIARRPSGSDGG